MTQQVEYRSPEMSLPNLVLVRRLQWGVRLAILTSAIPLLYGVAICLALLEDALVRPVIKNHLPEPLVVFWITLVPLVPCVWLLTKTTAPRSLFVYLEMIFARVVLIALIVGAIDEYRTVPHIIRGYAELIGISLARDIMFILLFAFWNSSLWAAVHLAARNLRSVGLKKCSFSLLVWLAITMGWSVLVYAFYAAAEYFHVFSTIFGPYVIPVGIGLFIIFIALIVTIEVIAIVSFVMLRRLLPRARKAPPSVCVM